LIFELKANLLYILLIAMAPPVNDSGSDRCSDSDSSDHRPTMAKRPSFSNGNGDQKFAEEKNKRLRNHFEDLTKQVSNERDKLTRENDTVSKLYKEKEELIYQIKHLKKRKEEVDRQNKVFEKMCADDGTEFERKARRLQTELLDLLNAQKDKVHKYGELLRACTGNDKLLDTYGLNPHMPEMQRELKDTLADLSKVLKATIDKKKREDERARLENANKKPTPKPKKVATKSKKN